MAHPLILVTGFGAFEDVETNPSMEIAVALEREACPSLRYRCAILPVSFHRVPGRIDAFFERFEAEKPALFMALGVQKEPWFRLESRAYPRLVGDDRPDVDGIFAIESEPYAELPKASGSRGARSTNLDVERIVRDVKGRGVEAIGVSDDAGGYVCERAYYRVLEHTDAAGIPGLFVHVPPLADVPLERQIEVCRWIAELALT